MREACNGAGIHRACAAEIGAHATPVVGRPGAYFDEWVAVRLEL
jgi:hypothetical protein